MKIYTKYTHGGKTGGGGWGLDRRVCWSGGVIMGERTLRMAHPDGSLSCDQCMTGSLA